MHNYTNKIIALLFSAALFLSLLFSAINFVVYNEHYYKWHYKNRDIESATGMDIKDLMRVTVVFIDYLKNDRDNLNIQATIDGELEEVFGQREKTHMVDVKTLAVTAERIRLYGGVFVLFLLIVCIYKNKKLLIELLSSIKYVFLTFSIIIFAVGALLISDFNKYFTIFHEVFFSNDLWLLDPKTDVLINIVPEIFFFTTAMLVIILFLFLELITIFFAEIIKKKMIKKFG